MAYGTDMEVNLFGNKLGIIVLKQLESLFGGKAKLPFGRARGILKVIDLEDGVDATGGEVKLPDTPLQELYPPPQELVSPLLSGEGLFIELLVLEFSIDVVADGVALSGMAVHEDHLVQVITEILVEKGVDVEVLPPLEGVVDHGERVLDFEVAGSEELEQNDIGPVILQQGDSPDGNLLSCA